MGEKVLHASGSMKVERISVMGLSYIVHLGMIGCDKGNSPLDSVGARVGWCVRTSSSGGRGGSGESRSVSSSGR